MYLSVQLTPRNPLFYSKFHQIFQNLFDHIFLIHHLNIWLGYVEIVFDLQMGEQYPFGDWNITITGIQDTSADFAIVETGETFNLSLNGLHILPGGYVIRLITIQGDLVRVQLFAPVAEE